MNVIPMKKRVKYKRFDDGSFFHNNVIVFRKEDYDNKRAIFHADGDESITAFLNGYAIIPAEEYCKLTGQNFNGKDITEADKDLHIGV